MSSTNLKTNQPRKTEVKPEATTVKTLKKDLPKDESSVEDMLKNIKSQYTMEQLEAQADEMAQHMPEDELEQHRQIDKKYKDLKSYQFDNKLREIVNECIKPLRLRLLRNNEQIA